MGNMVTNVYANSIYDMAYGESNGHLIGSQDGGLAEICTL